MPDLEARVRGSLLGLALGDALGARHEGGPPGATLVVGRDLLRWTDDTEMALGLAQSLAEKRGLDEDHLARRDPVAGRGERTPREREREGEDAVRQLHHPRPRV